LHEFATNPAYRSTKKQTTYFGFSDVGDVFKKMEVGDTFEALGTRSTTASKKRAMDYAGGPNGQVFEVVIPEGMVAVNAKVLDIQEVMLLPGAKFRVIEKTDDLIRLELVDDGSGWVKNLHSLQEDLTKTAKAGKMPDSLVLWEEKTAAALQAPKVFETITWKDVQDALNAAKAAEKGPSGLVSIYGTPAEKAKLKAAEDLWEELKLKYYVKMRVAQQAQAELEAEAAAKLGKKAAQG
jgi:hypothetical protein